MFNFILLIIAALLIKSWINKDKEKMKAAGKPLPKTENSGFIPDYVAVDFNGKTYKATKIRQGAEFGSVETEDLYEFLSFVGEDIAVTYNTPKVRTKIEREMGESFTNHTADVLALTRQLCVDVKDYRLSTIYEKLTGSEAEDLSSTYLIFRVFESLKDFASNGSLKLSASFHDPEWEEIYLSPDAFSSIAPMKKRDQAFPGEVVTFTGKIEGMVRRQAIEKAIRNGAQYAPALTKATTLLIIGDKADSKLIQQASEQGTKTITGTKFLEMISSPSTSQ